MYMSLGVVIYYFAFIYRFSLSLFFVYIHDDFEYFFFFTINACYLRKKKISFKHKITLIKCVAIFFLIYYSVKFKQKPTSR